MKLFSLFNGFALNASGTVTDVAEEITEKVSQDIIIDPSRFSGTLKHMGIGMLSIFIVIGVIILAVYALNKITANIEARKAEREQNDQ
jgi:uncharacterized membrane protein